MGLDVIIDFDVKPSFDWNIFWAVRQFIQFDERWTRNLISIKVYQDNSNYFVENFNQHWTELAQILKFASLTLLHA